MKLYSPRKGTTRTSQSDYADQLWAEAIKQRDEYVCRRAGFVDECWGDLQSCHVFPRRFRSTRWTLDNGVALCKKHHGWFDSAGMPRWEWIISELGAERYEALERLRATDWDKDTAGAINRLRGVA